MVYLKRTLSILSLSIFILCADFAEAYVPQRGNVMAYVGPYFSRTIYDGDYSDLNETMPGLALVASGDVSDHGALEMAAVYFNKYYFRDEAAGRSVIEKTQAMQVTIAYRRYWAPSFSTSLGVYTTYPMGGVKTVHTDFTPAEGIQTSAWSSSESGANLALEGEIWNAGLWAVMADARYTYAVSKQPNEYSDQYAFMIGLRYFIQSRVEKPKALAPIQEKPAEIKTAPENKADETAPPEKGTTQPKKKR
ncbi:hypothetical protein [Bdellovibrio sp. ZAP7]|uniref:hypothetical protein n=1 Tax=Bdellovibrio sp. ZAP7 TaxID=2231053 RepID=UPI001158FD9C|nr:hypothetical protein [Bdellovibrio sp. ZAP7]